MCLLESNVIISNSFKYKYKMIIANRCTNSNVKNKQ